MSSRDGICFYKHLLGYKHIFVKHAYVLVSNSIQACKFVAIFKHTIYRQTLKQVRTKGNFSEILFVSQLLHKASFCQLSGHTQ